MFETTTFTDKNGGISSVRAKVKYGKDKEYSVNYDMFGKSMITFKSGNFTSRLNELGQSMRIGVSTGKSTSYYGSGLSMENNLGSIE